MALRKAAALWLLLLALSPFTAPFSTCDLSTLSNGYIPRDPHIGKLSRSAETVVDELLAQLQSPEAPAAGRTKFFVTSQSAVLRSALVHLTEIEGRFTATARPRSVAEHPATLRI